MAQDQTHTTPMHRLGRLLKIERGDLAVLGAYTLVIILLTLAVPLAMQALVNTVARGLVLQPLVVLSLMVLGGLSLAGIMQLLQIGLVEVLQQRVFARASLNLADRLTNVRTDALRDEYAPELVNRFFDLITIQKSISKLMVDGLTAAMTAMIGILVLGFYSPFLLLLDILIVLLFIGGALLLGINGLRSSIEESREKYRVADWLEDIARCHSSLKVHGDPNYLTQRADALVVRYLESRQSHFAVNRRQLAGHFAFAAFASAGILAAGGWLVLDGQLTLGQLVAAQIIVTTILVSLDKLIRQADTFYDLLTGLDKVGHVLDLPMERQGGIELPYAGGNPGVAVSCREVKFAYQPENPVLRSLNLHLEAGERVSLVGASGAGKSTLASLFCGLESLQGGSIEIDGIDVREVDLASLRRNVGLAAFHRELFDGTIEENIRVGRPYVSNADVRWAVEVAQLKDDVAKMPNGLSSLVVSAGQNLSRGQIQRILIARAIVGRPRLLVLDEAFIGIDERVAASILDAIFDEANGWTIIDISHEPEVVIRTETVHVLSEGVISESGSPQELCTRADGEFPRILPFLAQTLTSRNQVRRKK